MVSFYYLVACRSCAFSFPLKMRHVCLFGLDPAGRLDSDCIADILAGAPPSNELALEGSKAEGVRERDKMTTITLRAMSFQAPVSTRRPSHIQWERLPLPTLRTADVFQP